MFIYFYSSIYKIRRLLYILNLYMVSKIKSFVHGTFIMNLYSWWDSHLILEKNIPLIWWWLKIFFILSYHYHFHHTFYAFRTSKKHVVFILSKLFLWNNKDDKKCTQNSTRALWHTLYKFEWRVFISNLRLILKNELRVKLCNREHLRCLQRFDFLWACSQIMQTQFCKSVWAKLRLEP